MAAAASDDAWATAEATSRKMMAARGYARFAAAEAGRDYTCSCAGQEGGRDDPPPRLVTFMEGSSKLGLKEVRAVDERLGDMKLAHATVVLQGGVTPPAKSMVDKMRAQGRQVEIFGLAELMFNLPDHQLVPRHRLLTPGERDELFERYAANSLPRMLLTDPVSRYYGLRRGQVMEVERVNASGFHKVYRIAI